MHRMATRKTPCNDDTVNIYYNICDRSADVAVNEMEPTADSTKYVEKNTLDRQITRSSVLLNGMKTPSMMETVNLTNSIPYHIEPSTFHIAWYHPNLGECVKWREVITK